MKNVAHTLVFLAASYVGACGGGGGAGGSGSETLTPKGAECGVAPSGDCKIVETRSDEERFAGLKSLSKQLLDDSHPLHNATLVGGEQEHPIGTHIQTVAIIMSTWDAGEKANDPLAIRRRPDGDLHNVAERLRCAADRLVALGPSAKASELVCWSLELWRVGRAYMQLASK
jgi:hypothetical protein